MRLGHGQRRKGQLGDFDRVSAERRLDERTVTTERATVRAGRNAEPDGLAVDSAVARWRQVATG